MAMVVRRYENETIVLFERATGKELARVTLHRVGRMSGYGVDAACVSLVVEAPQTVGIDRAEIYERRVQATES